MANFKNAKNLLRQRNEYARYFSDFRGVDFSSDHTEVADNRFAYLVNMYKDYDCGQGGAIETIPGFREIDKFAFQIGDDVAKVNGIHVSGGRVFLHISNFLNYYADVVDGVVKTDISRQTFADCLQNSKSISFNYGGYLYILDGKNYIRVYYDEESKTAKMENVLDVAYLPLTHSAIDVAALSDTVADDTGEGYENLQMNLLNPWHEMSFIPDGKTFRFDLPVVTRAQFVVSQSNCSGNGNIKFPDDMEVYQYGVKLPLAACTVSNGQVIPKVPSGYPNAIQEIRSGIEGDITSYFALVNSPPKPEHNTWNPTTGAFDFTSEQIEGASDIPSSYDWPYAYPTAYPGIKVVSKHNITGFCGKEVIYQNEIITKCTIAALHDNRVFLSGNPDFPTHIFWCGINPNTKVPDATYFGELNYTQAGLSKAPVVAMMPVGDSLMVLKKDGDEEESILLLTHQSGGNNLTPVIYASARGHQGIGALGPCINFRDDPIFLSRFGVDALGHVSTKYRRAIKHRSTLIDAKLLECDLSEASITEWNGYLVILSRGKIFMADSRQMYNTDSGNTEYEWYYLEDIGIYKDQFDEYVYAEFPTELTQEELLEITGGVELLVADNVRDTFGVAQDLIGTVAFESESEISFISHEKGNVYYKELPEVNEFGMETGRTLKYYVEPSGAKVGGTFDPALLIKAIGKDLIFLTEGGSICKFNFDKRDPNTRIIPNEYYDFNGRTIFSGCATKMDNCGIPHLNKTTVKRSMVLKTRSFKHSGLKVKIRTNKKDFTQVGRIVSGRATFDDPSFEGYTFSTSNTNIFSINEREKKWVEKQIFVFSDGFRCPIAIHYLVYRYNVAGRYKE